MSIPTDPTDDSNVDHETPVENDFTDEIPDDEVDGESWKTDLSLPGEDEYSRDWTKFNRRLAYIYPEVILPGTRVKKRPHGI